MSICNQKYLGAQERIRRFVEELRSKEVVIYGGGKIGTRVCRSLARHGIVPTVIWDQKAELIQQIEGIPVSRPDATAVIDTEQTAVIVTVYSENACRAIESELRHHGLQHVYSKRPLINALLYQECHSQVAQGEFAFDYGTCHLCPVAKDQQKGCDIYARSLAEQVGVAWSDDPQQAAERFVIPSMGLLITNHCNLTCKGCNHLRDLYRPSDNVRLDPPAILNDLRRLIDAVDFIQKVVVVGGEAFVHSDLATILEQLLHLPKIGFVQIITNGTVLPRNPRLYSLLANPRIMVEISGYGDYLPPQLRDNVQQFIEVLRQAGVRYQHLETLDWQDFGDFEHRGYDRKQHLRVYKTCCFVSNDLFDGKLFKCSRSVFATRLGRIPDYPGDYVDVRRTPATQLRAALQAFFENKYPEVCQHCDGTLAARMPAGIQISTRAAGT